MAQATCVVCAATFETPKAYMAKYCSDRCKNRSRVIVRDCAYCGREFTARRAPSHLRRKTGEQYIQTCSRTCAGARIREQTHRRRLTAPQTCPVFNLRVAACVGGCGTLVTGRRQFCSRVCCERFRRARLAPVPVIVKCRRCDSTFSTTKPRKVYCSQVCAVTAGRDRRRARKKDAYVEDVHRKKVYERDGWKCQLCGGALRRDAAVPHPKAPTIDHIIPLNCGGTHEYANVQAAHFICNSVKGDRGTDQLRLAV